MTTHKASSPDWRRDPDAVSDTAALVVHSQGGTGHGRAPEAGDNPHREPGWNRGAVDVLGPSLADDDGKSPPNKRP
jgi:hypothetical protein